MKKILSLIMPVTLAALFSFAGDAEAKCALVQTAFQCECPYTTQSLCTNYWNEMGYSNCYWGGSYTTSGCTTAEAQSLLLDEDELILTEDTTTKCAAGYRRLSIYNSTCVKCAAGTYKTGTNTSTSCTACAAGTYSAAGASSCTNCAAGTYASGTGNTSCTTCPAGTFANAPAMGACASCPSGTTSPAGSTSSSACVSTTVTNTVSGSCPSGMTKSSDGTSCNIDGLTAVQNISEACLLYSAQLQTAATYYGDFEAD